MNITRRKVLEACYLELLTVAEEEREAFDNTPEGLQESLRGYDMERNANDLEEACTLMEDVLNR